MYVLYIKLVNIYRVHVTIRQIGLIYIYIYMYMLSIKNFNSKQKIIGVIAET